MDVDGTMTDGKIYMGSKGEILKTFDIKDGYAIHEMLPEHGAQAAIVTGRESSIVENRARELEIKHVLQGVKNKKQAVINLLDKLGLESKQVAFIGDDVMDLEAMRICGFRGCPADATAEIKEICQFISKRNGGTGAIREFIEWLFFKDSEDV